jgi:hypothetical protein
MTTGSKTALAAKLLLGVAALGVAFAFGRHIAAPFKPSAAVAPATPSEPIMPARRLLSKIGFIASILDGTPACPDFNVIQTSDKLGEFLTDPNNDILRWQNSFAAKHGCIILKEGTHKIINFSTPGAAWVKIQDGSKTLCIDTKRIWKIDPPENWVDPPEQALHELYSGTWRAWSKSR